jgi:hypothetical protein
VKITTTIDKTGPFFTHDPVKTFRSNIRTMMAAVAAEGEADVSAQMRATEGGRQPISNNVQPNRVGRNVVGRVTSLRGKPWAVTAVVSVNNTGFSQAQGVALMAAAARVEAVTGAFRKTTSRVKSTRRVNVDELLKGIA